MSDYDFRSLNDKEFEILCADLIGTVESKRIERFKRGRDKGIDGRFFAAEGEEVILQCKHWADTPVRDLISKLKSVELPKIRKLNPRRYIVAVSNPLSRTDKNSIKSVLSPFVESESDIYGKEDLNDLLSRQPDIERRHYKLWLHSAAALSNVFNAAIRGRSEFSLAEIYQKSAKYVATDNHTRALDQLEKLGVVVITGEPGVGKTTLAEHLCLHYASREFQFLQVSENINEAESAFSTHEKQIFYFDDFLGRNYLEAISGREGSGIAHFMRRVASNRNKRFVLTSRTNILNQGKVLIDVFDNSNIRKNEYELRISDLSGMDKARILYNHIWFSSLDTSYVDALYEDKRYKSIIRHKNFNPRLISFVTDASSLEDMPAQDYWGFVESSLSYPAKIWEHAYISQHDDYCRLLVNLVVVNRQSIHEADLKLAYNRLLQMPGNASFRGRRDFHANVRILTGTFLARSMDAAQLVAYSVFNPSVADYVLSRLSNDESSIRQNVIALRTTTALSTLLGLERAGHITKQQVTFICRAAIGAIINEYSRSREILYFLAWAGRIYIERTPELAKSDSNLRDAIQIVASEGELATSDDALYLAKFGLENEILSAEVVVRFVRAATSFLTTDEEFSAALELLGVISGDQDGLREALTEVEDQISLIASEDIDEFVDLPEIFSQSGDLDSATELAYTAVQDKLEDLGVEDAYSLALNIVDNSSIAYKFERHLESLREPDDYERPGRPSMDINGSDAEIEDLFERT